MTEGTGYIEGNCGKSFLSVYLWTRRMWSECILMLSGAKSSTGRNDFTGYICSIFLNGQEYQIAIYWGVKFQLGQLSEPFCVKGDTGRRCNFWSKKPNCSVFYRMAI